MNRLIFAAALAAAVCAPALAEESAADLRQPDINKCVAAGDASVPQTEAMCTCLVDGLIEKIPGEDGAKMLKLVIADPKSADEAAAALGVSAADAQAFVDAHKETVGAVAQSCVPQ